MRRTSWWAAVAVFVPASLAAADTVVLDTTGFWRLHHELRVPRVAVDGELKPVKLKQGWLNRPTVAAPAGWTNVDFDDHTWLRGPARIALKTHYLGRLCMRGKFIVRDPSAVDGLALSIDYRGGLIVYLNGKEVARRHLPKGAPAETDSAEKYPDEAFLDAKGKLLVTWHHDWKPDAETRRRLALRERTLNELAIPAGVLRKGVNVLAIQVVRAPCHAESLKQKYNRRDQSRAGIPCDLVFETCRLSRVQLTAAKAGGLTPNAVRPEGLQVWNSDPLAADFDLDFGDATEKLQAIRLVGARNGSFSGKVVIGSMKMIRGLKVAAGPLTCGTATIPASNVRIRYGVPYGYEYGTAGKSFGQFDYQHLRYPTRPQLFGALTDKAPATVDVAKPGGGSLKLPGLPQPVAGAVVPVWVTVDVPVDAAAGTYTGEIRIHAPGQARARAPVSLSVADWTLPSPGDYATFIDMVQSPDTLAVEYQVPMWSKRHWELIDRSMQYLGRAGARTVYAPLVCRTAWMIGYARRCTPYVTRCSLPRRQIPDRPRWVNTMPHRGR